VLRMGLPVSYRNERIARLLSKCWASIRSRESLRNFVPVVQVYRWRGCSFLDLSSNYWNPGNRGGLL